MRQGKDELLKKRRTKGRNGEMRKDRKSKGEKVEMTVGIEKK